VLPEIIRPGHIRRTAQHTPAERATAVTILKIIATFAFVCFGWIFFRALTLADAALVLERMGSFIIHPQAVGGLLARHDGTDGRVFIALALLVALEWTKRRYVHPIVLERWPLPLRWVAYTVLFWTVVYLGTFGSATFIYFQF
jgi:hypothetical protein